MVGRHAYRRPTVGVHLICQRAQQHRLVAVWLVEITLLILLDDHRLLGGARLGREVEVAHAVALQPQRRLDILSRQRYVEIGVVVVGKGVVLSASHLYRYVEVGHVARAAEHQMLEQVGEPRMFGILVACSDLVQNVDGRELRRSVAVDRNRKAVVESGCFVSYHSTKIAFFVPQRQCRCRFSTPALSPSAVALHLSIRPDCRKYLARSRRSGLLAERSGCMYTHPSPPG